MDAIIGHNNPPSAIDSALEITAAASAWVGASPEILDEAMAKEASDLVAKLRTAKANLAAALKADLAPHDEAIAGVKALYKAPADQVQALGAQLLSMSTAWIQKERVRVAAEKALPFEARVPNATTAASSTPRRSPAPPTTRCVRASSS